WVGLISRRNRGFRTSRIKFSQALTIACCSSASGRAGPGLRLDNRKTFGCFRAIPSILVRHTGHEEYETPHPDSSPLYRLGLHRKQRVRVIDLEQMVNVEPVRRPERDPRRREGKGEIAGGGKPP